MPTQSRLGTRLRVDGTHSSGRRAVGASPPRESEADHANRRRRRGASEAANESSLETGDCGDGNGLAARYSTGPSITAWRENLVGQLTGRVLGPWRRVIVAVRRIRPRHQMNASARTPRCATIGGFNAADGYAPRAWPGRRRLRGLPKTPTDRPARNPLGLIPRGLKRSASASGSRSDGTDTGARMASREPVRSEPVTIKSCPDRCCANDSSFCTMTDLRCSEDLRNENST
jgi:hypothetical protein